MLELNFVSEILANHIVKPPAAEQEIIELKTVNTRKCPTFGFLFDYRTLEADCPCLTVRSEKEMRNECQCEIKSVG